MKGGEYPHGPKADNKSVPRLLRAACEINGRLWFRSNELELCKWELSKARGEKPVFEGPDKLITAAEACRGLGISRRTLRRWMEQAEAAEAVEAARRDAPSVDRPAP